MATGNWELWARVRAGRVIAEPATIRRVVGFRVVLPDASVLDVPEAAEYVVTDDGVLILRTDGNDVRSFPPDGWLEVRRLDVGPPPNVESLLYELCVDLGFCLPPDAQVRLRDSPPRDVDAFTDAVLIAERLDPLYVDKGLRRAVRDMVARHFGVSGWVGPGR